MSVVCILHGHQICDEITFSTSSSQPASFGDEGEFELKEIWIAASLPSDEADVARLGLYEETREEASGTLVEHIQRYALCRSLIAPKSFDSSFGSLAHELGAKLFANLRAIFRKGKFE